VWACDRRLVPPLRSRALSLLAFSFPPLCSLQLHHHSIPAFPPYAFGPTTLCASQSVPFVLVRDWGLVLARFLVKSSALTSRSLGRPPSTLSHTRSHAFTFTPTLTRRLPSVVWQPATRHLVSGPSLRVCSALLIARCPLGPIACPTPHPPPACARRLHAPPLATATRRL